MTDIKQDRKQELEALLTFIERNNGIPREEGEVIHEVSFDIEDWEDFVSKLLQIMDLT